MVQVSPLAVTGGLSAARFIAKLLMEVTTSWVDACWLQVQFLVSLVPRLLRNQGEELELMLLSEG